LFFFGKGRRVKRALLAAALFGWIGAGAAHAGGLSPSAEREASQPGVVLADVLEVKAVVQAIDVKKRAVALKDNKGRTFTLKADKAVKNFDQLKKGDVVLADFVESMAISLRKASAPQSTAEARLVSVAPRGAKPGVLLAETVQVTGAVESIDLKARVGTLQEPHRSVQIVAIDKSSKNLGGIKKGDEVVLRVTEAIAIKIEKRK
jgi:hypothetical protein